MGHPPYLVLSKMRVASRIHWRSPLFGSIQKEGQHPGTGGHPPNLVLPKMRVASQIMVPSPLSDSILNEGGIPVHGAMTPIWFHEK